MLRWSWMLETRFHATILHPIPRIVVFEVVFRNTMKINASPTWTKQQKQRPNTSLIVKWNKTKRNEMMTCLSIGVAVQIGVREEEENIHSRCTDENVVPCTCISQFFPFAANAVAIVGSSVMRWRRRACLSFKWKWPSKMAFMSCTVVACCSTHTHDAMHVYYHTECTVIYTRQKTWESCERKNPNSRQFMRVCVCESECFCFVHFHSKQYLFSSWMALFMRVCSHCKQREKNCLQNSKNKKRKKQMSMLVCITWNPPFSLELFTIRSSCWSACNWIHLSHRRVHSSIYLQMRQENKGRS